MLILEDTDAGSLLGCWWMDWETSLIWYLKILFVLEVSSVCVVFLFQIPAKPNYSLVLYYAAERPVNKSSLLGKFVDGTDMFRDSRFKLIPSIIEVSNTYR